MVGLGLVVVAPMLLHMATGASIGPRALPMFYAPLLAVLVLRLPIAIAVTAVPPLLNRAVTGLPPAPLLPSLVLNIGLFVLLVRLLRLQPWVFVAPIAYVASLAGTIAVAQLLGDGPPKGFLETLQTGWPGVVALAILGLFLDRWLR